MGNWNFDDDWLDDDEDTGLTPEQLRRLRAMVDREVKAAIQTELTSIRDKHTFIKRVVEKLKYLFTEARTHLYDVIDRILDDISWTWYDNDELVSEIIDEIEETSNFDDEYHDDDNDFNDER